MPKLIVPYTCPRCGYSTNEKKKMVRHFNGKKICPGHQNDIQLTQEVKEKVLLNKVFKPAQNPLIQIVNNNNILTSFINQTDPVDRLTHLLDDESKEVLCLEDHFEGFFDKRLKRLEDSSYRTPITLSVDDLIGIIDKSTRVNPENLENLNILIDNKLKKLKIYKENEWSSFIEDMGVNEVIGLIKSHYFDNYECYLIKSLHCENSKIYNRGSLKNYIEIYYKFLNAFDLPICVIGMTDEELLGHRLMEYNDYYLQDMYVELNSNIKSNLKKTEKTQIKKRVKDIVKNNSLGGINELNKSLLKLLQTNDAFKEKFINNSVK